MFDLTILGVLLTLTLRADTVELKSGERVEGTFRRAGMNRVVIETAGQDITFELDKVRAIYLGNAAKGREVSAPSTLRDALDALKALRSITESGVTFRDYTPRVLDAKVRVDRYLSSGRR